jgi:hypothetical protein
VRTSRPPSTGSVSNHTEPPTSIDHENNGVRRSDMPGARRVRTVVTTDSRATNSATATAARPAT